MLFIYRDNLESKQKEQADLKVEMEKMSELISDLRSNCQTLQHELSEVRAISKDRIDVAIQANVDNSRPSTRRLSNSSITQVPMLITINRKGLYQNLPQITVGSEKNLRMSGLFSRNRSEKPDPSMEQNNPSQEIIKFQMEIIKMVP